LIAAQTGLQLGELIWSGGDVHVYHNHAEQLMTQLARQPRALPRLVLTRLPASIYDYQFSDFDLQGYDPHPAIKGAVAV